MAAAPPAAQPPEQLPPQFVPQFAPQSAPEPAAPPGSAKKGLPFGLKAIIVLQVLTVLGNLLLLGTLGWAIAVGSAASINIELSNTDVVGSVAGAVISAICAIGLWRRQRWAWYLTMLQLGFFMLGDLASFFGNQPINEYAWSMLFNVGMVFYLNQREVQNVFRRKPKVSQEVLAS